MATPYPEQDDSLHGKDDDEHRKHERKVGEAARHVVEGFSEQREARIHSGKLEQTSVKEQDKYS